MHLFTILLCSALAIAQGRCAPSIPFEVENTETRMDTNIRSPGDIAFSDTSLLARLDPVLLDFPDRSQEAAGTSAWYKASPSAGFSSSKTANQDHNAILAANEGAFVIDEISVDIVVFTKKALPVHVHSLKLIILLDGILCLLLLVAYVEYMEDHDFTAHDDAQPTSVDEDEPCLYCSQRPFQRF